MRAPGDVVFDSPSYEDSRNPEWEMTPSTSLENTESDVLQGQGHVWTFVASSGSVEKDV